VKVTLWGTRGSLPDAGPETVRYGGNTSCVEVRAEETLIALDAGTGIRRLGKAIPPDVTRVDILLTHLHMDHIQGLGFFAPLYKPGLDVHIWGPPSTTMNLHSRLSRYLSPPLFPVRVRELPSRLTLHDVGHERFSIGPIEIRADFVCHPGPTLGYRLSMNGSSVAYMPDHEPALGARKFPGRPEWTSGFAIANGVDLLIHDAQYSENEYDDHVGWGHSSIDQTVAFAAAAGARRLVTFHHDPAHDDDALDRLVDERHLRPDVEIVAGTEGATFELS
jgi:phosphoribosyl 1,2-cyclic phosphodiesterase